MSGTAVLHTRFKHLIINNNNVQGRWMCDEEVTRYLRDDEIIPTTLTVTQLNRMITSRFIFNGDSNELKDDNGLLLLKMYRIKRQINLDKPQNKQFYYIQGPNIDAPNIETTSQFYTDIYLHHLNYQDGNILLSNSRRPFYQAKKRSSNDTSDAESKKNKSWSDKEKIIACWFTVYPTTPFPTSVEIRTITNIEDTPSTTATEIPSASSTTYNPKTHAVHDIKYKYVMDTKKYNMYQRALNFVNQLEILMSKTRCDLSTKSKLVISAFASAHPQVSTDNIELIGCLSRYILLSDANVNSRSNYDWINVQSISASTPSSSVMEDWVGELAVRQVIVARHKLSGDVKAYIQSDGGHKGQEVRLLSYYDPILNKISTMWLGLTYCGKTANQVAAGIKLSLDLFRDNSTFEGATVDSGAGTPESFGVSCKQLNICMNEASFESCGLHDLQSVFRLAMQHCIGEGGLTNSNAVQFLHTLFSLFDDNRSIWKVMVREMYGSTYNAEDIIPKELLVALQEPLYTRWWTLGSLSCIYSKYSTLFDKIASKIISTTTTAQKTNKIASNYIRFTKSPWLMSDVHFIAGICNGWFNGHFNWYQQSDPIIKKPGFLTFHRAARYYIMVNDLKALSHDIMEHEAFVEYKHVYDNDLDETLQKQKDIQRKMFISIMLSQLTKHNKRYLAGSSFIRSIYAERSIAVIAIKILKKEDPSDQELDEAFESNVHNKIINLKSLYTFWKENITTNTLNGMINSYVFNDQKHAINLIQQHQVNIYTDTTSQQAWCVSQFGLRSFGAHASTNHNNERLVKVATRMIKNGRKEKMANTYFIAANGFTNEEFEYAIYNEIASITPGINNNKKKRNRLNLQQKTLAIIQITNQKIVEYSQACEYMNSNGMSLSDEEANIRSLLYSEAENIKKTMDAVQATAIIEASENYNENARTKYRGMYIPPVFNDYYLTDKFCSTKNVNLGIVEKEFRVREMGMAYESNKKKIKQLRILLRNHEKKRFEIEINAKLEVNNLLPLTGSQISMSAKIGALKQMLIDKDELTSEFLMYELEIPKKYFKKQSEEYSIVDMIS
jgi:hypothetical protein